MTVTISIEMYYHPHPKLTVAAIRRVVPNVVPRPATADEGVCIGVNNCLFATGDTSLSAACIVHLCHCGVPVRELAKLPP